MLLHVLHYLAAAALGLTSAGFAGHFGYRSADRLPGESRMPQCVFCLRPLRWFEYLPLSWLFRANPLTLPCPCGKQKDQWPQPLAEITGLLLGIAAVAVHGWSWATVWLCLALGLLPAIALVDLFFGLIPDELNALLAIFGLGWLWTGQGDFFMALIGAVGLLGFSLFLAIVYSKWRKREMLGLGDVKLFAASGLWLPILTIPWFLAASGLIGAIFGLVWKHTGGSKEFPFAPAICLSLAGCIFWQLMA
jgi:leader peptidase (prepilin peptidase) / N-methyltransferase